MTLTLDGQTLLIGALAGLIVGWFITWLIFRSRGKKTQANIQELDSKLTDANSKRSEGGTSRRRSGKRKDCRSRRCAVCAAG
jgi:gas vesicle protein